MAIKIYEQEEITLLDGTIVKVSPLKLKYLHEFMDIFDGIGNAKNEMEMISYLSDCIRVAMKQFNPSIKTVEDVEDVIDLKTMYKIVDLCSGINLDPEKQDTQKENKQTSSEENSWKNLDLAKLESEVFVLGIWKNYEELESCMSLPELLKTIERSRELDYDEKKFLAAMQGVDLDEQSGVSNQEEDPWEAMKARVASKVSGIESVDANDITSFQGIKAAQAGFGIGMGLDYGTDI